MNACEFSDVTKIYGNRVILDRVAGIFEKGEMIAVVGKTGSGKSTLLQILAGIITPEHGQIIVCGIQLKRKNRPKDLQHLYMNNVSLMFQQGNVILEKTIEWNLRLPLYPHRFKKEEINSKVHEVMGLVGLNKDPKEKAVHLSGGEIRKLAFARAIIKPWEMLILDEPTANLDAMSAMQLMDVISHLHQGNKTILIATHDPEVIKRCDRTVLLQNGCIQMISKLSE